MHQYRTLIENSSFEKPLLASVTSYPVHVEGEEDLVHVAIGFLAHTLEVQDGLELEQRDEARRRLSHEHVVPVVHVLGEDLLQVRAVVPHRCSVTQPRERRAVLTHSGLEQNEAAASDPQSGCLMCLSGGSRRRVDAVCSSSSSSRCRAGTLAAESKPLTLLGLQRELGGGEKSRELLKYLPNGIRLACLQLCCHRAKPRGFSRTSSAAWAGSTLPSGCLCNRLTWVSWFRAPVGLQRRHHLWRLGSSVTLTLRKCVLSIQVFNRGKNSETFCCFIH